MWWPGRNIAQRHRLSPAETELAQHVQHTDGLSLHTPIGGLSGSSTRTELAAAILAIVANGPVHIGTDSQAFLDRAVKVIEGVRRHRKRKRNWQLVSDGDLWFHFEQAVKAKGWKSIRLSKVKGHVTQAQVDDGLFMQMDKDGNDKADEAADVAVSLHGESIISVGRILLRRYKQYITFMGHVVPHIIEAYMIHRKLIDSYGETCPKTNKQIKYSPIVRDPNASYNKLNMTATINNYQQFKHKNNCAADIWSYMEGLEVAGTGDAEYACTWLELYILYRMRGYGKPIKDNRSKARARACVLSQLNCFKRTFRGVAKRALCHKEELDLFKPLKIKHERFLGLGVQGKHAGFACCVLLSGAEAKQIERQIILLGRKLAESKLRQFMGGEITLEPHIPTMKGRAAWDSNIKICVNYKNKDPSTDICVVLSPQGTKRAHELVNFYCPTCETQTDATKSCFQLQDLDHVSRCGVCKANVKVRDWLCSCSNAWHTCAVHRSYCSKGSKKPLSNGPTPSAKRTVGPLTCEQLLQHDIKRQRRTNTHLVEPTPNMLSHKLRERFAYLFDKQ